MWKLKRYLSHYKKQVIIGPLFKLTEAILELLVPLVMAQVIDVGVAGRDLPYVLKMGGLLLFLGAVGLGCALVCQYSASIASQGVGTILRNDVYHKINTFSHAEIDRFGTHSLVTRLTNDINQLQVAVAMLIRLVVRAPFLAIGAVVMTFTIDLKLSLVLLITLPLIVLVLWLIMGKSVPFFKVMQKKLDRISLITRENLEGARAIRAFSKQETEKTRFADASDDLADTAVGVGRLSALLNPLTYTIMNIGIVAVLWFGGGQVHGGDLTQGEIIAFVNYMTQILLALVVVANLVVIFTKASASAARVNEVLETKSSLESPNDISVVGKEDAPQISFQNVEFSYKGAEAPSLQGVTVDIRRGETVGIIGGTGSGKSTLVHLIPRFYDITAGKLLVDGIDVKEYPLALLRKKIGLVPQKAAVVSGTIAENLRWGKENASEEELINALKTAQAWDFVSALPDGLETHIEQGGKNVSGGQKQRLTIARALVGKPEVLILDDSSSALDFATDAALRKALRKDTAGMTVIIVSQRAGSIRHADKIIVLDDGEVVGIGIHNDLFENCAVYREICLSQFSAEEAQGQGGESHE